MEQTKVQLSEKDMPRQWYNLAADLPRPPLPPLGPDGNPVSPEALAPVFPMNLIEQEMSTDRWIDIPEGILEVLSLWRPSPLYRARRLEKLLDTPARIYYKNEGVSPPGSHKPNTAVAQAWYNKQFGIERLTTETGAGQWGHGPHQFRPETLPPADDGDVGRHLHPQPLAGDQGRPRRP